MEALVVVVLLGAGVAMYLWLRKPSPPAPAETATPPSQRLQEMGERLTAIGEASSHPRDVAGNAEFREAAGIFETRVELGVVTDAIAGANWMLAAAACSALSRRSDRSSALTAVLQVFPHLRPWPLYYALRYVESLEQPPPAGDVILRAPDWWAMHSLVPAILGEHFAARSERGDTLAFGDAIASLTGEELTAVDGLIRSITHPAVRQLGDTLAAHRRTAIDRAFLQSFGRFVEQDLTRRLLVEHDAVTEQLAQAEAAILQPPHRSLVVVGEPRSGKSSFLELLATRAAARGWTLFEAGAPQLQAGQEYFGQLEERLRRLPAELGVEKRVLWHAPDFVGLAISGTHKSQSASILDQVLPAIASGRLVLVSEITPAALTRLLQMRPAIRTAFELVRLRPITDAESHRLANDVTARITSTFGIAVEPEALDTAIYLTRHYLGTGQMPGALIDLLKLAADRAGARDEARLTRADLLATTSQLTGMPEQVLDDRQRVDLAEIRAFFNARVIGQDEAVDAVVGRVAMLKAGLTDAGKPVGVFLFAGPTGTGKTELAKTLAEFLFGSADRLVRLDMSEFQSVEATRKIVGDPSAPDDTHALTDRVRKQPFSVVLLDEFEKAHPLAWDLFLQVFDDGRLTDAHGQTADFRHCIIILTSNVGSTIKQDASPGFLDQEAALSVERVKKAINQTFRPEFVNRLDRIVVFRALGRDDMRRIVAKELTRVLDRRGLRHRDWAVEWEASALEFLLDSGFSTAMGARPLKRAIDEHLLAPLAATLVEHRYPEGDQFLFVRSDGRTLQVEFVDPNAPADAAPRPDPDIAVAAISIARMMVQPAGSAAEAAALAAELRRVEDELAGTRWTALHAELTARMQQPDFWNQADRQSVLSRYEVMDRVKAAAATAAALAPRLERSAHASGRSSRDLVSRLASQLFVVRHGIEDALADAPVEVVLGAHPVMDRDAGAAEGARWCERLLEMYRAWSARRGMRITEIPAGSPGRALLVISGFGSSRLLGAEGGLHVMDYEDADDSGRVVARVMVAPTPVTLPRLPAEQHAVLSAALEKASATAAVVRRYRLDPSPLVRDLRHGWRTGRADLVFAGHFDVIGELSSAD
jgi:ATP-dependent Clp protease ATP-binding subunit ClpC